MLADTVGPALLVVLDTLTPAERLAFVLHDMFAVPFDEIAPIVGRSPDAARQLASRARRRVQGATPPNAAISPASAPSSTRFSPLAEWRLRRPARPARPRRRAPRRPAAVQAGASSEVRGAAAVAGTFAGPPAPPSRRW